MNYTVEYKIEGAELNRLTHHKQLVNSRENCALQDFTELLKTNIGFVQSGSMSSGISDGASLHGRMDLQVFSQETWRRLKIQVDRSIRHGSGPIIIKNLIEDFERSIK